MSPERLVTLAALALGAIVGSFLNVVIARLPRGRSIVRPGSACPTCGAPVRWYDNVPVLSWIWLRARCRACGAPISVRYPIVEAGMALLAVLCVRTFGPTVDGAIAFAFLATLVAASGVDLTIREIPDAMTLPGILLGLAVSPWSGLAGGLASSLVGALAGMGGLFLVASLYEWVRDREGMGLGDVKLLGFIGAVLGWEALVPTVLAAAVAGAAVGIGRMVAAGRHDLTLAIPFGPFLALGATLSLFWPGWWVALLGGLAG